MKVVKNEQYWDNLIVEHREFKESSLKYERLFISELNRRKELEQKIRHFIYDIGDYIDY